MNLSDFSLLKESEETYVVGHPKGRSITVPKRGLSQKAQTLVSKLKREQHFQEGGVALSEQAKDTPEQIIQAAQDQSSPSSHGASGSWDAPAAPGIPAQAEAQATSPAPGAVPTTGQTSGSTIPVPDTTGALKKEESTLQAGTAAEGAAGAASAQAYEDYAKAQAAMPTPQDIFQKHQGTDQALQQALMSQKIDPDRYLHNRSTGSKIAAGLGMILGGIGSGLTGQPNLAAQAIHQAIERDIEAQKNDQSKTMNLWKMNKEATQDETQATLATQNQMLNGVKAKALAAAARAQGPMAAARIAPVISQIDQQMAKNNLIRSSLDSSAQGGFSNADPATLVPYLVKDPTQQKQVYGEIQAAQNTKHMGTAILKSFEEAVNENTALRTGAGVLRTPASVYALHQAMQPTFADLEGTVRQAAMDNTFTNITPRPGDSQHTIEQKRESLRSYLKSKASAPTAKGNHIDLERFRSTSTDPKSGFTPQQQQFYSWATQNPNDPRAKMTLQKLGVD